MQTSNSNVNSIENEVAPLTSSNLRISSSTFRYGDHAATTTTTISTPNNSHQHKTTDQTVTNQTHIFFILFCCIVLINQFVETVLPVLSAASPLIGILLCIVSNDTYIYISAAHRTCKPQPLCAVAQPLALPHHGLFPTLIFQIPSCMHCFQMKIEFFPHGRQLLVCQREPTCHKFCMTFAHCLINHHQTTPAFCILYSNTNTETELHASQR